MTYVEFINARWALYTEQQKRRGGTRWRRARHVLATTVAYVHDLHRSTERCGVWGWRESGAPIPPPDPKRRDLIASPGAAQHTRTRDDGK